MVLEIMAAVVVALAVGGTSPWWWDKVTGEDNGDDADNAVVAQQPPPDIGGADESDAEPTTSGDGRENTSAIPLPVSDDERTTVELVYLGDADGCGLFLNVAIGDQRASPTSNQFTMTGVPVGRQDYRISGTIQCPTVGACSASGSGIVDVMGGDEFFVGWVNNLPGQCDVTLQ